MVTMEKWMPLQELDLIERRMRRLFEDLKFVPPTTPAADVFETTAELVVELDVPGFDERDLEIEVFDHTLAVKGERIEKMEEKKPVLRIHERLETEFERRFVLPPTVDSTKVSAEYAKGILTLHVPKLAIEKPKKVEIAKPKA